MTNKEILQANLLDILFENRNKNYGAYALRKDYNHRLRWALGSCLALSLLMFMINLFGKGNNEAEDPANKEFIQLIDVNLEKPKEAEQPKPLEKTSTAQIKDVTIKVVPDNKADNLVPENSDLDSAAISDHTQTGKPPTLDTTTSTNNPANNSPTTGPSQTEFHSTYENAEFPGGKDAFAQFLQDRLNTPDELETGQKQTVVVRFMVDVDGTISKTEIVQSGGNSFDREVMSVLKKMPKWKPAFQNGVKVPVYFTQLITFMGVEQ
jgi:protein TonB